jgi:D-proline reductase (dithiol) PrdB
MPVDSFKYLPGSIAAYYRAMPAQRIDPIPWTSLAKPLSDSRFALVTTAGVSVEGLEPGFDQEGERQNPVWGDPTFRRIPTDTPQADIRAWHLHLNNRDILADINVVLPLTRFGELEAAGTIGTLAPTAYSFMGYQASGANEWRENYAPEVAGLMKDEAVDCVLLTPA